MSAQHTPGPWVIKPATGPEKEHLYFDVKPVLAVDDPYRGSVCTVHDAENIEGITVAESEANARLIAAAPELLDVLRDCLHFMEMAELDDDEPHVVAARAAIAKATGSAS
jgi:hypothetical protein